MGCSGCGNNGPTPIVGNLDDGAVVMAYVGDKTAPVSYYANGAQYQGARDRIHDFARVRPTDAARLLSTGHWEIAPEWTPALTVVLPTRNRPVELTRCLESLAATAPGIRVVIVSDGDDAQTTVAIDGAEKLDLKIVGIVVDPGKTAAEKWNIGLDLVSTNTVVFAADDLVFHPEWFEKTIKALRAFPDGSALVGFDELAGSPHPLHFAATRKILDEINGGLLSVPHYKSWYMDTELCDKARRWGRYIPNCGAIVEHKHPMHGTAPIDTLHRTGFLANQHRDRFIYERRKAAGFPTDFGTGATALNWLAGYVPPKVDRTEEVLNARMGIEAKAESIEAKAEMKPVKKAPRRAARKAAEAVA